MIREAKAEDIPAIVQLGREALERAPMADVDPHAIADVVRRGITQQRHFMWVSEREGVIEGAVGALCIDFEFHKGSILQVCQYYCRPAAKGDGARLIREMLRWSDARRAIKWVVLSVEIDQDPRIIKLMERLGFNVSQVEMTRPRPGKVER